MQGSGGGSTAVGRGPEYSGESLVQWLLERGVCEQPAHAMLTANMLASQVHLSLSLSLSLSSSSSSSSFCWLSFVNFQTAKE